MHWPIRPFIMKAKNKLTNKWFLGYAMTVFERVAIEKYVVGNGYAS